MANILSAEFWEKVEARTRLRILQRGEEHIKRLTESGRVYGQAKLSPELAEAKRVMMGEDLAQIEEEEAILPIEEVI